ncbi:MAG: CHRD domain-containing protein [Actinomycetota bacterium]|nr:CHRD domain-containing protein [Actinomycetota bacterium]
MDEIEALDDATVDELLDGRYRGDTPELAAVSQLVEELRSFAGEPPPRPSPTLADILRGSAPASGHVLRQLRTTPSRHRPNVSGVATVAAAVSAALVAVILVAGSARLLPGPTQDLVARIVRTVTPFDFPLQREPDAVLSRAQGAGGQPPSEDPSGARAAPPSGMTEPAPVGRTTEGGSSGSRPPSGSVTPAPAPTTVAPPQGPAVPGTAAPTVPPTGGRTPDRVTGPAPRTPPPPKSGRLSAELVGAEGVQGANGSVALDTNPGNNQLCLTLTLPGNTPVSAVHLHSGTLGVSGRVVATFNAPPAAGDARLCVTATDQLMKEIRQEPGSYYVEVHTTDPLNGTLRGQLTK